MRYAKLTFKLFQMVIPGPLVTLLMEKKNVYKIVCQNYKSGAKMEQSF